MFEISVSGFEIKFLTAALTAVLVHASKHLEIIVRSVRHLNH
jgi:hypothetical protein